VGGAELTDVLLLLCLQYIAPELLFSGKYDGTRADTWWVLLFILLLQTRSMPSQRTNAAPPSGGVQFTAQAWQLCFS
jgi:hypothetical protein